MPKSNDIDFNINFKEGNLTALKNIKQQLLDLTYGVEYEWVYLCDQPESASMNILFNEENAPEFFKEWSEVEATGDDTLIEEFLINMYEQDIYRMYCMKTAGEHKSLNRYELIPLAGHETQPENTYFSKWSPVSDLTSWNWDIDAGFTIDCKPTTPMSFAFLKVKK